MTEYQLMLKFPQLSQPSQLNARDNLNEQGRHRVVGVIMIELTHVDECFEKRREKDR